MTLFTLAFDLLLVGTALWLGSAVVLDALHDRRPQVGAGGPRRQLAVGKSARIRSGRASAAALARP
jgi:hypothetical protein